MTSISKAIQSDRLAHPDRAAGRSHHSDVLSDVLQDQRHHIKQRMEVCRSATLALFQTVDYETFCQQAHPDFSPIGWHLGHIAYTEALWLLEHSAGYAPQFPEYRRLFAADSLPKAKRVDLPTLADVQTYLRTVRTAVFAYLETAPLDEQARLCHWLLQHESQHGETIALVLELMKREQSAVNSQQLAVNSQQLAVNSQQLAVNSQQLAVNSQQLAVNSQQLAVSPNSKLKTQNSSVSGQPSALTQNSKLKTQNSKLLTPHSSLLTPHPSPMLCIPAGYFECGNDAIDALDNERPVQRVYLDTYWLDRTPVTCEQYQIFMTAGGYQDARWWSAEGWEWLQAAQVTQPLYWSEAGDRAHHPVCGVSWYEADAYARFAGKRLPTEAEWAKAASWNPIALQRQIYPWGDVPPNDDDCNCNHAIGQTTPVDAYPTGISPFGCYDMIGNVWEWTASWFDRYAGFEAYPYRGYSEAYFDGQHRVLKGGSWATQPSALRAAFRNWYHPHVREILAGFRCAADSVASC